MILALGARGSGFNPRSGPFTFFLLKINFQLDPIKISEYFSVFVIRILTQLIKNHTTDIQMIIMQMFNKCFIQTKQHIYINQLHILLRDKSVNEILWDSRFTSEIEKLRKSIISRFSTYKHTKGGPPTFKNIHQFPSVDTVIQLYDAIEIIIPYAKNEQKNQLIGNLVSNTSNSYCLKVAVSGLLSSLRSLNLSVSQNNSIVIINSVIYFIQLF